MGSFRYRARGAGGDLVEGLLEAPSKEAVAMQLQASDLTPVEIAEVSRDINVGALLRGSFGRRGKVEIDDLILFCRQMNTLTRAGVPLMRGLRGLIETTRKPVLAQTLKAVCEDIESGRELSVALARHPLIFPTLLISMVQVGENTGKLDDTFNQVAIYLTREKEALDRIKQAMRYPTFVTIAIGIAMAVLSLFVIPTFEKVFSRLGAELPLPTRIILGVSRFSVSYWPYLLLGLVLLLLGVRQFVRSPGGRLLWHRVKLRLPIVGSILLRATLTRFARAFAMSFSAGVPLVQALNLTARAVDNVYVEGRLDLMRNGIERGDTLTRSARTTGMFTPLVLQMLAVGEETGAVDQMMLEVAEFYEREVDYDLKNLTSAIEPILIIFIGGMVLVLALGVFLPMWNLSQVMR
ncbi:type II secretion system F family protein [Trichloromonas sp.]|uniref:type II secretion system F family protein n=1 Tax=Trichloromonas sp. TaxID=3069249 RepID=UPI003D813A19